MSQEREVTMMLRHDLRTDAQICGKFASQASLFVHHGRDVNRVELFHLNERTIAGIPRVTDGKHP